MSVRPLPGASYHTVDNFFHSFDYLDLEAPPVDNNTPNYGASEKKNLAPFHEREHAVYNPASPPHSSSRGRHYRGPPVLLSVIILCCLAFVASAFREYSSGHLPLPNVPHCHAPLANRLSSALRTQSFRALVNEHYNGALEMTEDTFECKHDGCGENVDLRHYLLQTFPLEHPSVHRALVGDSAVVLHWQGTDSNLKPVLITNSHTVLASASSSTLPLPHDEVEHFEELADVQSGVGALIASDVLLRSGYQPSRTLVFGLMLGDASDALKVSEYLHDTYGELGLSMEFNPLAPECRNKGFKVVRVFHTVISRVSRAVSAIFFIPSHDNVRPIPDAARLFRYTFDPAVNQAMLTRLRIQATDAWVRLILGADWN